MFGGYSYRGDDDNDHWQVLWTQYICNIYILSQIYARDPLGFFSFVEFPYKGKKLAAYAEKRICTIYLHMETLANSWS